MVTVYVIKIVFKTGFVCVSKLTGISYDLTARQVDAKQRKTRDGVFAAIDRFKKVPPQLYEAKVDCERLVA